MMAMRTIVPQGIFATVINSLQLFHIPRPIMIVTDAVTLGGEFSPQLLCPTPANLVPDDVPSVQMDAPPVPFPTGVGPSANANQGHNWRIGI